MKRFLFLSLLIVLTSSGFSQLVMQSGAQLVVSSGSTVVANDGIINNGGTINNAGTVDVKGDIENNTSALLAATSTGKVIMSGAAAQEITGDQDASFYGTLVINNSNGVSLTNTATGADQTVNDTLEFVSGNLTLNGFNLFVGDSIKGYGATTGYVLTNSTGYLSMSLAADSSAVEFPVGNSAYNPITLRNGTSGTADTYNVRVVDAEPAGASTNHFVDRSWVVSEATAGGSSLTVTPQWNASEELTDFDRNNSAVGLTTDGGSTYTWAETAAASGTDPYTKDGYTFSGVGTFAMGDYFYAGKRLNLKFYLAGAYNTTNSDMDNTLYTAGLIPTTDPYNISAETTTVPAGAVDWIKVVLRSSTDYTVLVDSFAFFVDTTGTVLDRDGNPGGKIIGVTNTTPYYIAVHHRNHMGVMSNSTVDLSVTSPSWDFSTAQTQAWQDGSITTNAAMKEVETGVFGLWEGDATQDGYVKYNGTNADRVSVLTAVGSSTPGNIITDTYSVNDVNMDGDIKYNGTNADRITILSVIGASTPGVIYQQHLP